MRPLTEDRPKPLVKVGGKPLLSHVLDSLHAHVEAYVVVVGYRAEAVMDHYGDAYRGVPITYVRQEQRLGLAHAVLQAAPHVTSDFLVLNGDNVFRGDLGTLLDHHRASSAEVTVFAQEVEPAVAREGAVFERDDDGHIVGLVEKPTDPPSSPLSPVPPYVLPPAIFHACRLLGPSDRGEYELPDAIEILLCAGRSVETLPFTGWRKNVNTPDDIETVEHRLDAE